ncbi:SH3 domain-containing protein, partial [Acinetobacter baumannii]
MGQTDGAGANVRESPSTDAPVLGNLREGTVVEPLEGAVAPDGRPWRRVRGGGLDGWVVAVVVRPR